MTERERFERWAGGRIGRVNRSMKPGRNQEYEDGHTQACWDAWQESWRQALEAVVEQIRDIAHPEETTK